MDFSAFFQRWGRVISLVLFSVVWASLQWEVLRGLVTEGISVVDSPSEIGMLAMLLITLGMTVYAVRETLREGGEPL